MPLSAEKMREYRAKNPKRGIQVLAQPLTLAVLDELVAEHGLTGRSAAVDLLALRHDNGDMQRAIRVAEQYAEFGAQCLTVISTAMTQNRAPAVSEFGGLLAALKAANHTAS